MAFNFKVKLPTPDEIKIELPLSPQMVASKTANDIELRKIFTGESDKFVFVIGPCSAHDEKAVMEYVNRLAKIQEQVKDKIMLVPRIYTNKPRTVGTGYKGMLHQPDPTKSSNIVEGLKAIRRLHLNVIGGTGLAVADEMLYPENYEYLSDLLSYVAVGARSVENQMHRLTISGLEIPAGMKNPTSGDVGIMLNSVQAAQADHVFSYAGYEVETTGNPLAHTIMRGAVTVHGNAVPNYHFEDLMILAETYEKRKLINPACVVDANHANSNKKYNQQPRIVLEVLQSRNYSPIIKKLVKGVMVESFLIEGNQAEPCTYGQSITDPCIGWETTEKLILDCAAIL